MGLTPEAAPALVESGVVARAIPVLQHRIAIVRVYGIQPAEAGMRPPVLTGELLPGCLRGFETPCGIRGPNDRSGRGHQGAVAQLAPNQIRFGAFAVGDVALDGGSAHHYPGGVPDRRDRERDVDPRAVLPDPDGIGEIHPLAAAEAVQQVALVLVKLLRDEHEDRLAHHLAFAVTKDPLGGGVPARHNAVQRLAYDRIIGRGDDGGETSGAALRLLAAADVPHRAHDPERPARSVAGDEGALQYVGVGVVGSAEAVFLLPGLRAALDRCPGRGFRGRQVVGMDPVGPEPILVTGRRGNLFRWHAEVRPGGAGPDQLAPNQIPVPQEVLGCLGSELEPLLDATRLVSLRRGVARTSQSFRRSCQGKFARI